MGEIRVDVTPVSVQPRAGTAECLKEARGVAIQADDVPNMAAYITNFMAKRACDVF